MKWGQYSIQPSLDIVLTLLSNQNKRELHTYTMNSHYNTLSTVTVVLLQSLLSLLSLKMGEPCKNREVNVLLVYQQISQIIRGRPDSQDAQPQGASRSLSDKRQVILQE